MKTWNFGINMGSFLIVLIALAIPITTQIFRYLIYIKKIKPSKLSRIFYSDDESFINSWQEMQKKGLIRFSLKNTIIYTFVLGLFGVFMLLKKRSIMGYEQNETLFVALAMGIIIGFITSLIGWLIMKDRYSQLTENTEHKH